MYGPRPLLLAVLGAGLPLALYLGLVRPERARVLETADKQLAEREKEVRTLESIGARFAEWKREEQSLRERMALLDQIRPAGDETGPLVERLRALATAEGLAQVAVEPLAPGAAGDTIPIRLQAEGAQAAIASLLARLTSTTRLLRLDSVELERRDKGRYGLVVRLVAFRDTSES